MITGSGGTLHLKPPNPAPCAPPTGNKLEEVERRHILSVLERTGWRVDGKNGAAEILGLKRTTLQAKMKKLGIKRPTG
jgi:transcriptional regulator with GAF, ATPase, and Fis domain